MFCPGCGSNNQDDLKFCSRCGTNLEIVSDALRGRAMEPLVTDQRTVSLLKDYYRSRRMLVIGSAASLISLFKLALLTVFGFPESLIPLTILVGGLLVYGLLTLVWGITKWNNSSSELKALGVSPTKQSYFPSQKTNRLPSTRSSIQAQGISTGSISTPASVTEGTTNLLDDPKPISPAQKVP